MAKFVVSSEILPTGMDPVACATGVPKILRKQGITNVNVKSCYCCGEDRTIVFIAEAPDRDFLLKALKQIDFPVTSVTEEKQETREGYKCPVCGRLFTTEEELIEHEKKGLTA